LQVNEVGFDWPPCIGGLIAEEQEALVDLDVVLAFDVGGFELVHGLVGLEGDKIVDEPAEYAQANTDASDVGDDSHKAVKVVFEFVHGFVV
jgi:hypothetical protein